MSEPPAAAASVWEDFVDILYAPSAVFRRREHGSVFVPLLVVTLLAGTIFYLNSGALRPMFEAEFDRQMAAQMRKNPQITPEVVERIRGVSERMGQVAAFVFLPLAICGVALGTWLCGKLVDATQSLHAAFIVAAYAYVPRILEGTFHGLQGLMLDPSGLDGRFRLSVGPGRWLDPDTVSPLLLAIVGRLDVFTLWITALVAIGLSVTGRIPIGRAAIAAALVWILGALPLVLQALR